MAEPTIIDVMTDPALLGPVFGGPSWFAWRVLLKAAFGLPLAENELPAFRAITGRSEPSSVPAAELWFAIARRGGKSQIAALVAVFLTCFRSYRLAPGERGVFMVVAPDRRQSRVIKGYVSGLLKASPLLAPLVAREVKDAIDLTNGLRIEIHTASFRTTRGYTVVGAILDEGAFLPTDDAAEPDKAILAAIRPAMATVAGAVLMFISSPYARRGELWRVWQRHFGKNHDPILVAQAGSKAMNPTLADHVIAAAYEQDESAAASEFGGQFRSDLEELFKRDVVEACVVPGRRELPPVAGVDYVAFVDPSGGSADSMTLAVAHAKDGRAVLDAVRERCPPFSPDDVVREFATLLKSYRIATVTGDAYSGEWTRERFRTHGITYQTAEQNRSELYLALLPLVNAGRAELLDDERLMAQLVTLERRTSRSGRDSIDHAPGAHDDRANAVAGALVLADAPMHEPRIRVLFDDEEWEDMKREGAGSPLARW